MLISENDDPNIIAVHSRRFVDKNNYEWNLLKRKAIEMIKGDLLLFNSELWEVWTDIKDGFEDGKLGIRIQKNGICRIFYCNDYQKIWMTRPLVKLTSYERLTHGYR